MFNKKFAQTLTGLSKIVLNYKKSFSEIPEDDVYEACKFYISLGLYARAGNILMASLKAYDSERLNKLYENLKKNIRLSKTVCKIHKTDKDDMLSGFGGSDKDRVVGTEITTYDEHGNPVEFIKKGKLKVEEYWRREYQYQYGDVIYCYTQYDKDGNVDVIYNAIVIRDGKVITDELEDKTIRRTEKRHYEYDDVGLLVRSKLYVKDKECSCDFYKYDKFDRKISQLRTGEVIEKRWDYEYIANSNQARQSYFENDDFRYKQIQTSDFMGNVTEVLKLIKRSDCGWTQFGYYRTYDNVYVKK